MRARSVRPPPEDVPEHGGGGKLWVRRPRANVAAHRQRTPRLGSGHPTGPRTLVRPTPPRVAAGRLSPPFHVLAASERDGGEVEPGRRRSLRQPVLTRAARLSLFRCSAERKAEG